MKSAITISFVKEAEGGPFVFWHDLEGGWRKATELGFDAIEIFPAEAASIDREKLKRLYGAGKLKIAAMGTGAGWVKHKLLLTSPDSAIREKARGFAKEIIALAAEFNAPTIIGSMQGRVNAGESREQVLFLFRESVDELAAFSASKGQILLIEPLNRYESNLLSSVQQGLDFLGTLKSKNVKLLNDVFHMNIEEANIAESLRKAGPAVGHVHFADSNRLAVGLGHIDYAPIIQALRDINYSGYISGEILPLPNSEAAAAQTIKAFKELVK